MNELFLKIINMSISASWLILAVLILRLVLKKAPKWVNVLLWGIVAVRLICPFSFESALSLIPSAETFPEKIISGPSFDVQTGITPIDNRINDYLGDRYFEGVTVPANNGNNIMTILTIVWTIGILLLVAYTVISYWRLHREIDTAVRYKDNIFQSENVSSPFVLGIIKPRIYLPFSMNDQDLEHVVAHEQAHICRKDHWWKPLGFLLLTVHWFNPLMWLAYVLLCRDIELACDEKVIKELSNEERADYTQALVACSVNRRMIAACPLAFGEVGVKERVKSVMNYKKPAFWIIVLAVITCVVVAVCFLTNPAGTALTKWTIDEVDMSAALSDVRSMTVRYNSDSVFCSDGDSNRFIATMDKIRVGRNSISQNRDSNRDHSFTITINDNLHLHFSFDFSEIWVDNGVKPSFSYPITNPETARELMLDFSFTNRGTTEQWFDYLDNPEEMQWDGRMEANIPEFPDATFRWYPEKMEAVTEDGITPLYTGMPIWNAYFCDLTGDSLPELCSTISWGSGMIDSRVIIYDYANGASYELSDRGNFDFTLRFNEADGYLYVTKMKYNTDELIESGRLVFKNDCLQVEGFSSNTDEPAKYYLTIGAEGVKSIELSMPNSSGGFENADGSLLKKGERIWLEHLNGYTDLRGLTITALGENGEIIWTASIPNEDENKGFTHLVNNDWEITDIE
jgi:beta-lactamase regulating signal transducer with metallopeptidase domain